MNDAFLWAKNDAPVADIEEWAILMAYAERADDDGCNAYQSIPTIAKRARISEKTVSRRVKSLEDRGLLRRGDQSVVEYLPVGHRPIVYDMQIPARWFPNLDRINEYRQRMGRGPIGPDDRPDLAPAPEQKKRADAGKPRRSPGQGGDRTTSPQATGLQVPPDEPDEPNIATGLQVRAGTTSPPTLGVKEGFKGTVRTSSSTGDDQEEKNDLHIEEKDQELEETAEFVKSSAHWPTLTEWEQALADECCAIGGIRWPSRMARKVIGSRTVREITARNPELVRTAFLIGAKDSETVPMRMWHVGTCPHWTAAEKALAADASPAPEPVEPIPAEPVRQPLRAVPAPSPLQDSADDPADTFPTKDAALAAMRERISKGQAKFHGEDRQTPTHAESIRAMDQLIVAMSTGRAS